MDDGAGTPAGRKEARAEVDRDARSEMKSSGEKGGFGTEEDREDIVEERSESRLA